MTRRPLSPAERILAEKLAALPLSGFDAKHARDVAEIASNTPGLLDEPQRQAFWRIVRRHHQRLGVTLEEVGRLEQMRAA